MAAPILQFKRGAFVNLPGLRAGEPALTSDTFDLYVGIDSTTNNNKFFGSHRYWNRENTTNSLTFKLVDKNGSNYIGLKSPDTLAGIATYTLPASPIDGYFLKTNESGILEWALAFNFDDIEVTGIGTINHLVYNSSTTSGISTIGSLFIGTTKVLSTEGGLVSLSGIATLDATTRSTFESLLSLDPNDFNTLNVAGISTIGGLLDANGGLDVTGQTTLNNSFSVTGVSTFLGTITGTISTATRATLVDTTETGTDAEYYPTFVSASVSTESQTVRTDGGISYNPNNNTLTIPNIKIENLKHSNGTQAIAIDTSGNVGLSSNLTIVGNLFVNGSTTSVNTETLKDKDSLIDLGKIDDGSGNLIAPTSDLNIDIGVLFNYFADTASRKAAVYWDDSVSRIAVASRVTESNSILTASAYAALEVGGLWVNNTCTGGASEIISCFGGTELEVRNVLIDAGTF